MAYFLMNGKDGHGTSVCLLNEGYLYTSFDDISEIDLITMKISREKSSEIIKEYNPTMNLDGFFYIASTPNSKGKIKTYAPIFEYEDDNSKKCLENLAYFAAQREYKIACGDKKQLDKDQKLESYIRTLLYNVLNRPKCAIMEDNSVVAKSIKDILNDRYMSNKSTIDYINANIYNLRDMLSGYTALRNFALEYVRYKNHDDLVIRNILNTRKHWENDGMELVKPVLYEKENASNRTICKQLKLDEFMYIPKIR